MSATSWTVSKVYAGYRFKFTTESKNYVYVDLAEPLFFDTLWKDALSLRGANGVRIHLVEPSKHSNASIHVVGTTRDSISTSGIAISTAAYKDVATYITNKNPIEHFYSD